MNFDIEISRADQTWGNRILYSYSNTIRIHFLSNREVFYIREFLE